MEWISVKDRLPDKNKNEYFLVLVDINGDIHFDDYYSYEEESFRACDGDYDIKDVTHWIEIGLVSNYLGVTLPEEAKLKRINSIKDQIIRHERRSFEYKKELSGLGIDTLSAIESLQREIDILREVLSNSQERIQLLEDAHGNANIGRALYNKYHEKKKGS